MKEATIRVDGMSCQHCVMRLKKAVSQLSGVAESQVDVGTVRVAYDESKLGIAELNKAIAEAGYKVVEQK